MSDLYDSRNQYSRDMFSQFAYMDRFSGFPCTVGFPCGQMQVPAGVQGLNTTSGETAIDPKNQLGIATNNGILDYQFSSTQSVPYCGVPLDREQNAGFGVQPAPDCKACPCTLSNDLQTEKALNSGCDFGFARTFGSIFGPNGGNRNGLNRWG